MLTWILALFVLSNILYFLQNENGMYILCVFYVFLWWLRNRGRFTREARRACSTSGFRCISSAVTSVQSLCSDRLIAIGCGGADGSGALGGCSINQWKGLVRIKQLCRLSSWTVESHFFFLFFFFFFPNIGLLVKCKVTNFRWRSLWLGRCGPLVAFFIGITWIFYEIWNPMLWPIVCFRIQAQWYACP